MKNKHKLIAILFISTYLAACSTGQSAFKKGNYYDATLKAVRNLRTNPDSQKSLDLVQKSYPMALEYYKQRIDQQAASNNTDKYLKIVETYEKLNTLADEITRCPAALELVKPVVYYHKQLYKAEELACNEQFENAIRLMQTGSYTDARLAIPRLNWVKEKQSNFPGIDEQLMRAKNLAIIKTVVEFQPVFHNNYEINSDVFYNRIYNTLRKNTGNQYTRFYTPEEAEKGNLIPHEILSIQFRDFKLGQLAYRERERSFESDSIVVGTYTNEAGDEFNAYGTVKAEAISYERELLATGKLKLVISDYRTGEVIRSTKFPNEYFWKNHWATYNGDKRALPDHILELSKNKQELPPSPQEMFLLFSDPLFHNASTYLKSYYKHK